MSRRVWRLELQRLITETRNHGDTDRRDDRKNWLGVESEKERAFAVWNRTTRYSLLATLPGGLLFVVLAFVVRDIVVVIIVDRLVVVGLLTENAFQDLAHVLDGIKDLPGDQNRAFVLEGEHG